MGLIERTSYLVPCCSFLLLPKAALNYYSKVVLMLVLTKDTILDVVLKRAFVLFVVDLWLEFVSAVGFVLMMMQRMFSMMTGRGFRGGRGRGGFRGRGRGGDGAPTAGQKDRSDLWADMITIWKTSTSYCWEFLYSMFLRPSHSGQNPRGTM